MPERDITYIKGANPYENYTPPSDAVEHLHQKMIPFLPIQKMKENPKCTISASYTKFFGPRIRISKEDENGHRTIAIQVQTKAISYSDNPESRNPITTYPKQDSNTFIDWCTNIANSLHIAEDRKAIDWIVGSEE